PPTLDLADDIRLDEVADRNYRGHQAIDPLLKAQGVYRIQTGRFLRGIEPEAKTGRRRRAKGHRHRIGWRSAGPCHPARHAFGNAKAECDTEASTEQAERHRL